MIIAFLYISKVWALADTKRQGFLGFGEFVTSMQVKLLFYFIFVFYKYFL
jgi:hypothetical protein